MTTFLRCVLLVVGLGWMLAAATGFASMASPATSAAGGIGVLDRAMQEQGGSENAWNSEAPSDRILLAQLKIRSISVPTQVRLPATGGEIVLPVELDDAAGLTSYRVQVHFPANLVTFARADNGNTTLNWPPPVVNPRAEDVIVVNAAAQAALGGGALINLVFEVRQGGGMADFALGDLTELNDGEIEADMMEKPRGEGEGEGEIVRGEGEGEIVRGEGEGEGEGERVVLAGGEGEGENPSLVPGEGEGETAVSTPVPPDVFEPDDSPERATWIGLNAVPQSHNFHRAGDADWAAFYAPAGNVVTLETRDLGPKCSTILELFSGDTMTSLAVNSGRAEGDPSSLLTWNVEQNALFYVQVRHSTPTVFGQGTEYKLTVGRTAGACTKSAAITGAVTDSATHYAIAGAQVIVGELGQRLSWPTLSSGAFTIPGLDKGSYTVHAKSPGYKDSLVQRVNLACGGTGTANITLVSTTPPPEPKGEGEGESETPAITPAPAPVPVAGEGEGEAVILPPTTPPVAPGCFGLPPNSPLNKTTGALAVAVVAAGALLWVGRRFL